MHTCEVPIQTTLLYDPAGLLECDAPREGDLEQGNKLVKASRASPIKLGSIHKPLALKQHS